MKQKTNNYDFDLTMLIRHLLMDKIVYAWEINLLKKPTHQVNNYIMEVGGALLIKSEDLNIELTAEMVKEIFSLIIIKYGKPKNWNNHFPDIKHYCDAFCYIVKKENLQEDYNS